MADDLSRQTGTIDQPEVITSEEADEVGHDDPSGLVLHLLLVEIGFYPGDDLTGIDGIVDEAYVGRLMVEVPRVRLLGIGAVLETGFQGILLRWKKSGLDRLF